MSINQNIATRQDFDALPISEGVEDIEGYFRRLHELIVEKYPSFQALDPLVMNDAEAYVFGSREIEFGKHANKPFKDVPDDYLDWLYDKNIKLMRYIRWRRLQEGEEEYEDSFPTPDEDDIPF